MKLIRISALTLAAAFAMHAQNGTVQNAAVYQASEGIFVNPFSDLGGVISGGFGFVEVFGYSSNIISPRMLAVLTYTPPAVADSIVSLIQTPAPVNAALFLRPVGSSTLIPVTVANAVTGAVTFVVPAGMPLGGAELLYQINGGATQWTTVNVVQSSFAFFTNGPGGAPAERAAGPSGSSTTVGLTTPVRPNQTLILSGSGLGYGTNVTATIGGVSAPVLYSGPSGTQPAGTDEIWLQVPSFVADGCYVPVIVSYNQNTASTTVSKTSNGLPCQHPWGLSVTDMKTLDSGGYLAFGEVTMYSDLSVVTVNAGSRDESAYMNVSEMNAGELGGYFPPPAVVNGCNVAQPVGLVAIAVLNGAIGYSSGSTTPTPPGIGNSVTLQGPTAAIVLTNPYVEYEPSTPLPSVDGPLSNLPTPAIAGGTWAWRSSGSADLVPSSFTFTLPPPIQLNGGVPISVNHTQDQTISWNDSAFDAGATVNISLESSGPSVTCNVPATTGTVTIPASLLSGFSPNTIGTLTLSLNEAGAFLPHAELQLTNNATLLMIVSFSSSDSRPVFFQ